MGRLVVEQGKGGVPVFTMVVSWRTDSLPHCSTVDTGENFMSLTVLWINLERQVVLTISAYLLTGLYLLGSGYQLSGCIKYYALQ